MTDRSNGTNGELSIDEVLEKDPLIRELLDEDEVVEYISYKKGRGYKFFMFFLFFMGLFGFEQIFKLHSLIKPGSVVTVIFLFSLSLFLFIEGKTTKLVLTNKGIIIRSVIKLELYDRAFCTDKFHYSEIKEVGWVKYAFLSTHIRLKIKNKEYHSKGYPYGSDIKLNEAKFLSKVIKNKLKGVD